MGKIQGVIIITQGDNPVAVEEYTSKKQGQQLWKSWTDILKEDVHARHDYTLSDYKLARTDITKGRTDRQIAFMLRDIKPDRSVTVPMMDYAVRNGVDPADETQVNALIAGNPARYDRYRGTVGKLPSLLNATDTSLNAVEEFSHVQRMYELKRGVSFMGSSILRGENDVAWMFRSLENKAVENVFAVFQRGEENFILHAGTGQIDRTIVDIMGIAETARRFQAEKVWFVHNHPSGKILASPEDYAVYETLAQLLPQSIQPGIIINTDTGKYGVFQAEEDGRQSRQEEFNEPEPDRDCWTEIPVLSFDRQVFNEKGKDEYFLNSPEDIAEFISTQRLGRRSKCCVLVTNNNNRINGVFHLPYSRITAANCDRVARQMVSMSVHANGRFIHLYGRDMGDKDMLSKHLPEYLEKLSGGMVRLVDALDYDADYNRFYSSYTDTYIPDKWSMAGEMLKPYGEQRQIIPLQIGAQVIRTREGRGLLHCTAQDGTYHPAVFIRKAELAAYDRGQLTLQDLVDLYWPKQQEQQTSLSGRKR